MDRINGLNHIMESLRRQFSENVAKSNKSGATQRSRDSARSQRSRKKASVKQLENRVIERISRLDRDSREYDKQARQVFIESVIAWQFGEHIMNDERFPEMARSIIDMFDSDDKMRKKMQVLIDNMSQS